MSYSIFTAVLLAVVALTSSLRQEPSIFARFYSDFGQLYRPSIIKPHTSRTDQGQTTERHQFLFTEKEFLQIPGESLTMLNVNVIQRTITYHPSPNFEVVGSRYFYRRDPKESDAIEIELVNSVDRLFREVRRPNRYFYLSSFDNIEYSRKIPVMPYYEVTFICDSSYPRDNQTQSPVLSYLDKSYSWTPRYVLDFPLNDSDKQPQMYAYADIGNSGEQSIILKGVEFIAGDIKLNPKPFQYYREGLSYGTTYSMSVESFPWETTSTRSLGEKASGTHVYELPLTTSITLAPHSTTSVKFFQTNVTIEPFVYYSSGFSTMNSNGKLSNAYNITSFNTFIPNGRLLLREQERFVGQINLPDLSVGETYTMVLGYDADISYRRQVKILEGNETTDSITYNVEYIFENYKPLRDVRLYFIESYSTLKYFKINNISTSNDDKHLPDLISYGTDLRGYFVVPCQHAQRVISYNVVTYKVKPTINVRDY